MKNPKQAQGILVRDTLAANGKLSMRPLSASQAIAPAFHRTIELLYRPFRWSTHLKLTMAAVVAEGIVVNFRYGSPGALSFEMPSIPDSFRYATGFRVLEVVVALLLIDAAILFFYSLSRLRLAIFHCCLRADRSLLHGWKLYEKQAGRVFGAKVAVWLGIFGLIAALIAAIVLVVFTVSTLRTPDGKYDAGVFLILFFPTVGLAALILVASVAAQMVLNDFILPHMALENATLGQAWRSVRPRIRADREAFFGYFLLRVLIFIVAIPILACLAFLALWPVLWILHGSAAGYAALLEDATGILGWVRVILNAVFLVLGAAAGAIGAALLGGPLAVFLRCHAIYFYGSRCSSLGDALHPQESAAAAVHSME